MARKSEGNKETPAASKYPADSIKKRGRKPAKHSNPEFVQMSCYISRDVRARVKMRLFEESGEFSALVEGLLREWLKS